jgi:hypothetical protein
MTVYVAHSTIIHSVVPMAVYVVHGTIITSVTAAAPNLLKVILYVT